MRNPARVLRTLPALLTLSALLLVLPGFVEGAIPPPPTLIAPLGNVANPTPTYTWTASSGATEYLLQVYDSVGTRVLQRIYGPSICTNGVCSFTESKVLALGSYTWKVRAKNAQGSSWSPTGAFNVVAPVAPTALLPSGSLTNASPDYSWTVSAGATSYLLRVFNALGVQQFQRSYTPAAVCTAAGCTANPGVTLTMGDYTWTVSASHASGSSTSAAKAFDLGCETQTRVGDFDGNGRTDRLCSVSGATYVSLSTGTGFLNGVSWLGRYIQKPIVADFDGDGRTDVGEYVPSTGAFSVALSTGTSFGTWSQWGIAAAGGVTCSGTAPEAAAADMNGDGRADVTCKKQDVTSVFVGLSTGTSFTFSNFGETFCGAGERTGTLDMDGDGKSDWFCLAPASNFMLVYRSTGSALQAAVSAADASFCDDAKYVMGDWNGDGRTDLGCLDNGKVRLSTGNAWLDQGSYQGWCANTFHTEWPYAFAGDVDGDGTSEMICGGMNEAGAAFYVRKWTGTGLGAPVSWITAFCWGYAQTGDFDGDGKTDLVCEENQDVAVAGTSTLRGDLLVGTTSPLGGTETVEYRPATEFPNGPGYGGAPVVTELTVSDGRGGTSTSTWTYAGGKVNKLERASLGFETSIVGLPCLASEVPPCPYSVTTYSQGLASAGRVLGVTRHSGDGTVLSRESHTYEDRTTLPRRSLLRSSSSTSIGPPGTERTATVTYDLYDDYGNLTRTTAWGDPATNVDDLETNTSYATNTTAYIVDRPGRVTQGPPGGPALTQEERFYDGASSWQTPPSKGALTTLSRYLEDGGNSRWVQRTMTHTTHGALESVTDEESIPVETIVYDEAWSLFPEQVTNAAGETVLLDWEKGCGAIRTVTDPNGQTTTTGYDELCRVKRVDAPLGGFEERDYLDFGSPTLQRVRVETNAPPGVSGVLWRESFLDGLGREYRTESRGDADDPVIVSERVFNPRGRIARASEPYYENDPFLETVYAYDALDRVVSVTTPASGTSTTSYTASSETTTDVEGKWTRKRFDHFGRVVGVDRPFEGGTATTTFRYDRLGRRDQIVDPVQATFTWVFDSLGRVRTSTEPDRGTTGFTWDDAGRLWTQTDAKAQVTILDYDGAGRLETRTSTTGTATYVYGESRSGYFNVGRLTSILWPSSQDTLRFDYDALGRVARQWRTFEGVDYTVSKTWGAGGYHLTTTYPDGETVGPMGYDEAGRVKSVPGFVSDLTWDALGRPDTKTNANGVFTDWTWSPNRGLLDRIKTTTAGGAILQDLNYTQRAVGLVQSVTSPVAGEGWTYDYDDFYHLTTATNHSYPAESQTFDYDAGGRIETNSRVGVYTYATGRHRPQTVGGSTLVYDANGNLVSGGGRAPVWNAENLITQVGATQFKYDALGERVKKTSGTTTSLYPFGDDYEITNGVVTKYISIEGVGVVAKKVTGGSSPGVYWFLSDHLGSLQGVLDGNGAAISRRTYRPYGQTLGQSGSHTESRGWIDQRNDTETGLTYLHARYFDPQLGVFLSADPIGVEGGLNQYAYGFGDPINWADRSGLAPPVCREVIEWACVWYSGGGGCSPVPRIVCTAPLPDVFTPPPGDPFPGSPGVPPGGGGGPCTGLDCPEGKPKAPTCPGDPSCADDDEKRGSGRRSDLAEWFRDRLMDIPCSALRAFFSPISLPDILPGSGDLYTTLTVSFAGGVGKGSGEIGATYAVRGGGDYVVYGYGGSGPSTPVAGLGLLSGSLSIEPGLLRQPSPTDWAGGGGQFSGGATAVLGAAGSVGISDNGRAWAVSAGPSAGLSAGAGVLGTKTSILGQGNLLEDMGCR